MFLQCLNPEEIAAIEKIGILKQFPKGFHLIEEGMVGSSFILILSGTVEVRKGMRGGKYKRLVELGPCDLIGEVGFLGVENRTASVVALDEVEVMEFEREVFSRFIETHPMIGMKAYRGIAEELARRLSQSDEDLMDAISWALASNKNSLSEPCVNVPHVPKLARRPQPAD
ncbi:MAG: cyclic nucleotide-binding domain-containing protein [Verrucomicrobia bacterium]|jgi:CRP/FNR family transcriptional regulator, cyclic AMP receptor protein|nr:cyclic nucleotide-binding domain-containing protein [Verrucomicrobiota bacterium]